MKSGVRCLRVSPDGQLLAAGDRSGNLRCVWFLCSLHNKTLFNFRITKEDSAVVPRLGFAQWRNRMAWTRGTYEFFVSGPFPAYRFFPNLDKVTNMDCNQ